MSIFWETALMLFNSPFTLYNLTGHGKQVIVVIGSADYCRENSPGEGVRQTKNFFLSGGEAR
jgi:hypothetical protein